MYIIQARPFRFSTGAYASTSREELISQARKIEDLGFDVWVHPDHFLQILTPAVALMAVADATKTLRVGSYVYGVDHICDDLQRRRDRFGISYVTVYSESTDTFAPIVARLAGR
jgi:hypothetical protein